MESLSGSLSEPPPAPFEDMQRKRQRIGCMSEPPPAPFQEKQREHPRVGNPDSVIRPMMHASEVDSGGRQSAQLVLRFKKGQTCAADGCPHDGRNHNISKCLVNAQAQLITLGIVVASVWRPIQPVTFPMASCRAGSIRLATQIDSPPNISSGNFPMKSVTLNSYTSLRRKGAVKRAPSMERTTPIAWLANVGNQTAHLIRSTAVALRTRPFV